MKTHHAALTALFLFPSSIHGFSNPSVTSFALRSQTRSVDVAPRVAHYVGSALYSSVSNEKSDSLEKKTEEDLIAAFEQPASARILTEAIPYEELTIGVSKETFEGENRVSITPDNVEMLVKAGFEVVVQSGAGENASFSDAAYLNKGATVLLGDDQFFATADIISKICPPSEEEVPKLAGKTLIGMISPSINTDLYNSLAEQNTNVFALDCVPRVLSRAQSYDVLSSQANIAGYRAVVEAAEEFPRFFAGQMTAAGKVPPAKVLVLGAGVAGLAAIQVCYRPS
jgi:NAD(P) transhydrogenase